MSDILRTEKLGKHYPMPGGGSLRVFEDVDFTLKKGELAAVMGASGAGKTTLLNLLGALDRPSRGRVYLEGEDIFAGTDRDIAAARNRKIGFVFQFFHLLPEFTALENVAIPLMIRGVPKKKALDTAKDLLREVALESKFPCRPAQLSGGEQQRVAVARALVNAPRILLADEPTGNLDWKTGENVLRLVLDLHAGKGLSSIIVTHNERIARSCHSVYVLEEGRLKRSAV
jgi:ABC-type lipoprotein export system ATPase subunit